MNGEESKSSKKNSLGFDQYCDDSFEMLVFE